MKQKNKVGLLIVNLAICATIIAATAVFLHNWGWLLLTLSYAVGGLGIILSILFFCLKKEVGFKLVFVLSASIFVMIALIVVMNQVGNLDALSSDQKMQRIRDMIASLGAWGMLVYVLVQVIQVVILPLPAVIFYVAGTALYGAPLATLLASVGVIIGSFIAFGMGKVFGRKVVVWIVGREKTAKYSKLMGEKGKVLFVFMQLLPFFPDDILCMVAGLTSMSWLFFGITMIIVRPLIIASYCFLGSGDIIPFHGWGIYVWIAILLASILITVFCWKYQARMEAWFCRKFFKKRACKNADSPELWRTKHINTDQSLPAVPCVERPERRNRRG